jgi:hypothetical protein
VALGVVAARAFSALAAKVARARLAKAGGAGVDACAVEEPLGVVANLALLVVLRARVAVAAAHLTGAHFTAGTAKVAAAHLLKALGAGVNTLAVDELLAVVANLALQTVGAARVAVSLALDARREGAFAAEPAAANLAKALGTLVHTHAVEERLGVVAQKTLLCVAGACVAVLAALDAGGRHNALASKVAGANLIVALGALVHARAVQQPLSVVAQLAALVVLRARVAVVEAALARQRLAAATAKVAAARLGVALGAGVNALAVEEPLLVVADDALRLVDTARVTVVAADSAGGCELALAPKAAAPNLIVALGALVDTLAVEEPARAVAAQAALVVCVAGVAKVAANAAREEHGALLAKVARAKHLVALGAAVLADALKQLQAVAAHLADLVGSVAADSAALDSTFGDRGGGGGCSRGRGT